MSIGKQEMSGIMIFAFDFDGVILDSAGIKFAVFDEIFDRYPEYSAHMKLYTRKNAGYSRYVQFRYFFKELMGMEYGEEKEKAIIDEFADKVLDKVLAAPFIDGALKFVKQCKVRGAKTYIVTGTPQDDISKITKKRGIDEYFDGVFGSPALKEDILTRIIEENGIRNNQLMFFGDAMSDYEAAKDAKTAFTGVGTLTEFPGGVWCIRDFTELV